MLIFLWLTLDEKLKNGVCVLKCGIGSVEQVQSSSLILDVLGFS